MHVEEIVQHILSRCPRLTREDVMAAIEKKKTISGGFLTDAAAARLVATECGAEITLKKSPPKISIRQLVSGLNDVTVAGRVLHVNMPHSFPRVDGNGQVARLVISDKTGTIDVVLWNDKAQLAEKIQPSQIVRALHGYVRQSRYGEIELHIGQRGDIQVAPSDERESDFPPIKDSLEKIVNIQKMRGKVNVEGVIQKKYPTSTFQRQDGTQGRVTRTLLEDETGLIPTLFWNKKAGEIDEVKEGTAVLLTNVKVRESRQNELAELHIGDYSNVEILTQPTGFLRIKDLKERMRITSIEGTIATKPTLREVTTRTGEKVFVASFELKDDTGKTWVSAWRSHAKKVEALAVNSKVRLKNVYVRKGFRNQLEISTRASTEIETP